MNIVKKEAKCQGKISQAVIPKLAAGFRQRWGQSLLPEILKAVKLKIDD